MAIGLTESIYRFQEVGQLYMSHLLVRHGLNFPFSILRKLIELVFLHTFTHAQRDLRAESTHVSKVQGGLRL